MESRQRINTYIPAGHTAGPQVQGRSASYVKSYTRGFCAGSNPKPGDLAEN
jgi:hypothetical protein